MFVFVVSESCEYFKKFTIKLGIMNYQTRYDVFKKLCNRLGYFVIFERLSCRNTQGSEKLMEKLINTNQSVH